MARRISLTLLIALALIPLRAAGYGYEENFQKKVDEKGRALTDEEIAAVREDIVTIAKSVALKNPKYGASLALYDPQTKKNVSQRMDCSGMVSAVYASANVGVFRKQAEIIHGANGVKILYDTLTKFNKIYRRTMPGAGDIIFFDNTYDKNNNGKNDDLLVHTGIVVAVDADGTITYVHASASEGTVIAYANLNHPETPTLGGKRINSALRRKRANDPKGTKYYSGSLINSFGTVLDVPRTGTRF